MDKINQAKYTPRKDLEQIRTGLRQAFIRSKYRKEFLDRNRIEVPIWTKKETWAKRPRVFYLCQDCMQLHPTGDINVDHIKKVGAFDDILRVEDFFFSIWCDFSNLQILCKTCHKLKTKKERSLDTWIRNIKKTLIEK